MIVIAPDGWQLRYQADEECGDVYVISADGVPSYHWSGDVGGAWLEKMRQRFMREHAEQQLTLWEETCATSSQD